jgi:hypothetical protein
VLPAYIVDFARECLCDNRMAALALGAGSAPSAEEVMQLAAEARALYMMVSLECEHLPDRIAAHEALWRQLAEFYEAASLIWPDVPQDGEFLSAHRHWLDQLCGIARDRVELYSVSDAERRDYRQRQAD